MVVALAINGIAQVSGQLPRAAIQGAAKATLGRGVPPCASTLPSSSAVPAPSQVNPSAHSVTLSWKASVPRSRSQQDAIQGYYVYRSKASNSYNDSNQLNSVPMPGTQCIDTAVAPGGKYFYVVRAVAASKLKSDPSSEVPVVIPSP